MNDTHFAMTSSRKNADGSATLNYEPLRRFALRLTHHPVEGSDFTQTAFHTLERMVVAPH